MRRRVLLPMLVLALAAVLPACDFAKVGARCSASQGAARNNTHVLFCVKGKWKASLTIGQAADMIISTWPGSITGASGEHQVVGGERLPFLVLRVTTKGGKPAANTDVRLTSTSGPGFEGTNEVTLRTDQFGVARTYSSSAVTVPEYRVAKGVGDMKVVVSAGPLRTELGSMVFHVNGGKPASIVTLSGGDQTIVAGGTFQPWVVQVRDAQGAAVGGVDFKISRNGLAGPFNVSDNAGTYTITAPPQYLADTVSFGLEITAVGPMNQVQTIASTLIRTTVVAAAADDAEIEGDLQSTLAGSPFAAPIVVSVIDQFGNPVRGTAVTLTAIPGGSGASGSVTSSNDYYNTGVQAYLQANGTAGSWTLRAAIAGLGDYDFTLTNT